MNFKYLIYLAAALVFSAMAATPEVEFFRAENRYVSRKLPTLEPALEMAD
jgi:hypothetical protein